MLCKICEIEREDVDFYGKELCYRCEYKRKMGELNPCLIKKCRECETPLRSSRWVYCCSLCAHKGEKKMKKDYWTNQL